MQRMQQVNLYFGNSRWRRGGENPYSEVRWLARWWWGSWRHCEKSRTHTVRLSSTKAQESQKALEVFKRKSLGGQQTTWTVEIVWRWWRVCGWIQISGLHCTCELADFAGAFTGSPGVLRAVQIHNSSSPQAASSGLSADFQRVCLGCRLLQTSLVWLPTIHCNTDVTF